MQSSIFQSISLGLSLTLGLLFALPCSQSSAQERANDGGLSKSKSRWITAEDAKLAKAKQAEPSLTQYELQWEPIETHQNSTLKVSGKDYKFSQEFTDGEAPFFNAFEEELEPGKYFYSINFIPNEIGEHKRALETLVSNRKELLKKRREATKSGKREQAKSYLKQANEMRQEAGELQGSRLVVGEEQPFKFIKKYGYITVDKNGVIKVFDIQKERDQARKKAAEALKFKRAKAGTEEGYNSGY